MGIKSSLISLRYVKNKNWMAYNRTLNKEKTKNNKTESRN